MSLTDNLAAIQQRIKAACDRCDREPNSVALLAVTKGHPPETVQVATELGLVLFGENKIQEAKAKIPLAFGRARWHFIGHLQSNKCRDAVELFEMVQSVDSLALAQELNKRADAIGKTMPVLLEVNVAGEASKFGYKPDRLLAEISEINSLTKLDIHGLMTVPPYTTDPDKARPHFKRLRELKRECEQHLGAPLPHLSMGMSGDFEVAIEEGASIIRIGSALFGERSRSKKAD